MTKRVPVMTFAQLKQAIQKLEQHPKINDETKIFFDTGWDSVQEVAPDAFSVEEVAEFTVEDAWSKEVFVGYTLVKNAEKLNATKSAESVIVIQNIY